MNKKVGKYNAGWDELDDIDDLLAGDQQAPQKDGEGQLGSEKQFSSKRACAATRFDKPKKRQRSVQTAENKIESVVEEALVPNKTRRRSALSAEAETSDVKLVGYESRAERLGDESDGLGSNKDEFNRLLAKGVYLLGMREHSVYELTNKLNAKTEFPDVVLAVIDELLENDYVSDTRFAESYVRSRASRGFGPIKIRAELSGKGVRNSLIGESVDSGSSSWFDVAREQYEKKYRTAAADYKEWTKRARFLQSRGFSMEHIQAVQPSSGFY